MTETVSKAIGYQLVGSIDGAAKASKVTGYQLVGTIDGVIKVSKLLGYQLISLTPPPRRPTGVRVFIGGVASGLRSTTPP